MLLGWYKKGSVSPLILLLVIAIVVGSAGVMNPGLCGVDNPDSSERLVSSEVVSLEAIEDALKHADWEGLAKMLAPTPEAESLICNTEPKLRFLKGHALLAANRNNEATVCFACAEDTMRSATLKAWQTWTKDLVRKHPDWPSARYLYADALARLGLFEEAAFELDQVLAISPQDHLARNARGVVNWVMGVQDTTLLSLQDSAIVDFQVAAQQAGFADAWANLGVLDLYQGYDPEHAKENFNQALSRDSSFALAVNGRACAFGASGDLKQVRRDLSLANSLCHGLLFVVTNAAAVVDSADTTSYLGKLAHSKAMGGARGGTVRIGGGAIFPGGFLSAGGDYSWKYTHQIYNMTEHFGSDYLHTINATMSTWERGGLYVLLKEGANLVVDREGNSRVVGTWFVLNYPLLKLQIIPQESKMK